MEKSASSDSLEKVLPKAERKWQYAAALSAAFGSFCMGNVLGYSSPALPKMQDDPALSLSDVEASLVGSLANVGFMFTGTLTVFLLRRLGRKSTIMLMTIPFIFGWLLIISAVNVYMLYIGRIVTGFCAGTYCVASPMYIAEVVEVRIRGRFGNYYELMDNCGILFAYLVGWAVGWRWLATICCASPLMLTSIFYFMPETPSYLIISGKIDEARRVLQKLRGDNYDIEPEILILSNRAKETEETKGSFKDLVTGVNLKIFTVAMGICAFQQIGGVNSVIFYSTDIFESAGFSLDPSLCVVIIGIVLVVATFCSTLLVDRLGRKPLLLISGIGGGVSMIPFAFSFYYEDANLGLLALLSLMCFLISCALGFGPLGCTITGEIFPLGIRELAASICMSFLWFCSFIVTVTFIPLSNVLGLDGVYWMYSGINFVGVAFIYFFFKETKGKTLEQIVSDYSK